MNLKNRTVLITGGTSGIGLELVNTLAPVNNEIIVIGRNTAVLEELTRKYSNVASYECSLNSRSDVEQIIGRIVANHPDLSVVINNAGIQETPTFLGSDFQFDSIEKEITINLMAPIWICALVFRHFLKQENHTAFINVTSGLAIHPKTGSAVYCATKAGLRNFTRSFRYQMENTNVKVFEAIMPLVDTPMTLGRGRKKISAMAAAKALIEGVEKGKEDIYIGISRLIPLMTRISPSLMAKILKAG